MGAACSRHNKVTQIKIAPRPQIESSTDELLMNFGRPKTHGYRTPKATTSNDTNRDVTTISTSEMEQTTENVKQLDKTKASGSQSTTETVVLLPDKREPNNLDQAGKAMQDIAARDTVTKDTGGNTSKHERPSNKQSDIDITRKVGEILDTLIPPESPVQSQSTRVGRQSRLMHADLNTVVSYDFKGTAELPRTKGTKQKERKGKPTVKPGTRNNILSPESPTDFHVCKHGIPLIEDLYDEEGVGCTKCQELEPRGVKEQLKRKRASRKTKRKAWAKTSERLELFKGS